jgi:hypothetical protein
MHFGAIKPIFENAEFLRKNMTHEEKIVWGIFPIMSWVLNFYVSIQYRCT